MANEPSIPWGHALAMVRHGPKEEDVSTHEVGTVWRTAKGNLQLRVELVPLSWLTTPTTERRLILKPLTPAEKRSRQEKR